jgi:hypothetical protein
VPRFTLVFQLTPPEVTYHLPSLWFLPVRENIERSVKGEKEKVTSPSTQPTPPPSQPPPPSSSAAFTPEDKQALERKREELLQRKRRIEEAIKSAKKNAPDKKPTEEQEEELKRINQELAEIEARLKASETKKPKIEVTKEEFEKEMQQIVDLLKTKSLDEINQILVSLGVEKLKDQSELDNLRKDETQLRIKALEIVLARIKENVINAIIKGNQEEFEQIWREEESKLSQSDRQKLAHYQQLEREANEISAQIEQQEDEGQKNSLNQKLTQVKQEAQKLFSEIQPLVLDIYKKAKKRFYEKHKGEIDSEFERIKKQINEWEKEGTKVGSK